MLFKRGEEGGGKRTDLRPISEPLMQFSLPLRLELLSQLRLVTLLVGLKAIRVNVSLSLKEKNEKKGQAGQEGERLGEGGKRRT
jgi:hypothetical protein